MTLIEIADLMESPYKRPSKFFEAIISDPLSWYRYVSIDGTRTLLGGFNGPFDRILIIPFDMGTIQLMVKADEERMTVVACNKDTAFLIGTLNGSKWELTHDAKSMNPFVEMKR